MNMDHESSVLENKSVATDAARDIARSLGDAARSEFRLASAEFKQAAAGLKRSAPTFFVASAVAILGALPLVAFLVIGLGRLLNDNYWLSSLIVGALFSGIGGLVAYRALQEMKLTDMALPRTRESLLREQETISRKVTEISRNTSHREAA